MSDELRPPYMRYKPDSVTRTGRRAWHKLTVGVSVFVVVYALFEHDWRCDESCNMPLAGKSWAYEPTAWQWDGQLAIAGVALASAVGGLIAQQFGTTRVASVARTFSWCALASYVAVWFT